MLLPQNKMEFVSLSSLLFSDSQSEDGPCGPVWAQLGKEGQRLKFVSAPGA